MLFILFQSLTQTQDTKKPNPCRHLFGIPGAANLSCNHLPWSRDDRQSCGPLWMQVVVGGIMTRTSFSPYAHATMLELWLSYFPVCHKIKEVTFNRKNMWQRIHISFSTHRRRIYEKIRSLTNVNKHPKIFILLHLVFYVKQGGIRGSDA